MTKSLKIKGILTISNMSDITIYYNNNLIIFYEIIVIG